MRKLNIDQEAKRSSNLGLGAGMLVFFGLGGCLIVGGIDDICINTFSGFEFWLRLIFGIFFLVWGLLFIFLGAVCAILFRRRRKLKRELKEMFKNDSHLA
jgi:hypothetical protein